MNDELDEIVDAAEHKYGVIFCGAELRQLVADVVAKCEHIGKGEDYLPILFRCELKNKINADLINAVGFANRLKKEGVCVE
ncbi:MAG: hypothetical protein OSJ43_06130 [Oscillospiraceae bacterium]|nr:hypothetical protein [Oscillospiraceae bacterium]